jgi:hypothetical protein
MDALTFSGLIRGLIRERYYNYEERFGDAETQSEVKSGSRQVFKPSPTPKIVMQP